MGGIFVCQSCRQYLSCPDMCFVCCSAAASLCVVALVQPATKKGLYQFGRAILVMTLRFTCWLRLGFLGSEDGLDSKPSFSLHVPTHCWLNNCLETASTGATSICLCMSCA